MESNTDFSVTRCFAQLQAGDVDAAQRLWRHFCPELTALAGRTLKRTPVRIADAEDVVQSAFFSFWQRARRHGFSGALHRNNLWHLLAAITVRKALKQYEREQAKKRGGAHVIQESVLTAQASHAGMCELVSQPPQAHLDMACQELLEMLDEECRTIVLLKFMQHTNREIAELLNCTERKVERKLHLVRLNWEPLLDD